MSVLPIYTDGSPFLRKKAQPVTAFNDEILKLVMDMFETMRKANGIGLAANQVGILKRVIVIDISEMEGLENVEPLALINPEIVKGEDTLIMEEGCLSVPHVRDEVERAEKIRVRFKDASFNDITIDADGILARVILHEADHLDGILFIDHLSPAKRKLHEEELKKIRSGELEVDYPVITAADVHS
jgi:peptide deformylase